MALKPIKGGRSREIVHYSAQGDMRRQAQKIGARFRRLGGAGGIMKPAYEQSLKFLIDRSIANLNEAIAEHRRPQFARFRNGELERVIRNQNSHTITNRGFRFMVEDKVRAQIPYAFSLEYGDKSQVDQYRYLIFLGPPEGRTGVQGNQSEQFRSHHKPDSTRGTDPRTGVANRGQHLLADRIIGKRELETGGKADAKKGIPGGLNLRSDYVLGAKRYRVKIKNPVPAYRYGRDAGEAFNESGLFAKFAQKILDDYLEGLNVEVVPAGTAPVDREAKNRARRIARAHTGRNGNSDVVTTQVGDSIVDQR